MIADASGSRNDRCRMPLHRPIAVFWYAVIWQAGIPQRADQGTIASG
jgi:hypothetical protein